MPALSDDWGQAGKKLFSCHRMRIVWHHPREGNVVIAPGERRVRERGKGQGEGGGGEGMGRPYESTMDVDSGQTGMQQPLPETPYAPQPGPTRGGNQGEVERQMGQEGGKRIG